MNEPVKLTDEQVTELRALQKEMRTLSESVTLARYQFARDTGMTHGGARDIYTVLGYPSTITSQEYRELYERGGIAGPCVDALPKAVWRGDGALVEDQDVTIVTAFEQAFYDLNDRMRIWSTCMRAHILASLSRFSVLLLGAEGLFDTELPVGRPEMLGKPGGLLYVQPYEGDTDVTVASWEEDVRSSRFGKPKTYQLKRTNVSAPELQRPVHWTRVVHVPAEGFLDDAVYGPPALKGVWNYFIDLMKIVGGGGEASWLRANPITQFDTDKNMEFSSAEDAATHVANMKAKAELIKHQLQRWVETRGVKVSQVGSNVADFSGNADQVITLIAGTRRIPKRILTGSEMGELASSQDRDNWNDTVKDCRANYAHPVILRQLIERLIAYDYLPMPIEWEPAWPDVSAMNEMQKLAAAKMAATLNDHGEKVITGAEIREMFLDKEPLDPEDMDDEEEQVQRLEAALRKGGTLSIAVKP